MNVNKGFTLIELMIVVAIVSITLTIGLPSFQSIIASNRLTSAANSMMSALQLARMEALKQHKKVHIKKNTNWKDGWFVFVDGSESSPVATFNALKVITATSEYADTDDVYYGENGRIVAAGSFTFSSGTDCRKVEIELTGRVKVTTPSSCS